MQKLLESFRNSFGKYWFAYVAVALQFFVFLVLIWWGDDAGVENRRWMFAWVLFTQFVFAGALSLYSWWSNRDVSKVQKWWADPRVNMLGVVGLAALVAGIVYLAVGGRTTMELEPFTVISALFGFYAVSIALLYRGNPVQLWNYLYELVTNYAVGYFFGLIFWFGIGLIIFALDSLFKLSIDEEWLMTGAAFGMVMVANAVILTRLQLFGDVKKEYELPRAWQIFEKFVAFPLMSIYTLILLFYFASLLVTGDLPANQLVNTILALYIPGVIVIYLGWPLPEQNKYFNLFYKIWLSAALVIDLMYFYAIYLRVNQYGFTVERFAVILVGICALLGFGILASNYKHRLLVSLLAVCLFPVLLIYTPMVNIFDISRADQTQRLITELQAVGRLQGNTIQTNAKIGEQEEYFSVQSKLDYLMRNHGLNLLDEKINLDLKGMFNLTSNGFMPTFNRYEYQESRKLYDAILGEMPGYKSDNPRAYYSVKLTESDRKIDIKNFAQVQYARFDTSQKGILTYLDGDTAVSFDVTPLHTLLENEYSTSVKDTVDLELAKLTFTNTVNTQKYTLIVNNANFYRQGSDLVVTGLEGYVLWSD